MDLICVFHLIMNFYLFNSRNPNGDGQNGQPVVWPKFDMGTQAFANFDINVTSGQFLQKADTDFWLETIPKIVENTPNSINLAVSLTLPTGLVFLISFAWISMSTFY